MPILKEESQLDELNNRMVVRTTYDNSEVLRMNAEDRAGKVDGKQFAPNKFGMALAMRIDMGDVQRLRNLGYNLLSPDRDERKRALLYIQSNEQHLMTVNKKPFAKKMAKWV